MMLNKLQKQTRYYSYQYEVSTELAMDLCIAIPRVFLFLPPAGPSGSSALRLYPLAPSTGFAAEIYAFLLDFREH